MMRKGRTCNRARESEGEGERGNVRKWTSSVLAGQKISRQCRGRAREGESGGGGGLRDCLRRRKAKWNWMSGRGWERGEDG
jgi:hypothetical protein